MQSEPMFKYRISHKVRTVADLAEPTSIIKGVKFQPFASGPEGDEAWLATEDASAPDVRSAVNGSRTRLLEIVDALAVVLQCSFSLIGSSYMAHRVDSNPDCIIFFRHSRPSKTVGMTLWKPEQVTDVERLLRIGTPGALRYLREAMNAATSSACLAMLVTTAEGLAGQGTVTKKCRQCGLEEQYGAANRGALLALLGQDVNDQLYVKRHGSLRNKLMHGSPIDEAAAAALCHVIYLKILDHLKQTFTLKTVEEIVGAPRRFDSLQEFSSFLRCTSGVPPSLSEIEKNWGSLGERIDEPAGY
jgi:hypothetical protein